MDIRSGRAVLSHRYHVAVWLRGALVLIASLIVEWHGPSMKSALLVLGLLLATGCGEDASCVEGGRTFAEGESWTCSDGCNLCGCVDGNAMGTLAKCPPSAASNPAAGKRLCEDGAGGHEHAETWSCPNASATCVCNDGTIEQK